MGDCGEPRGKAETGDSRLSAVCGASFQGDLQHPVAEAHKERAVAVQDLQAQDWLARARWEELHLLQVAALQVLVGRGQRLQNAAVLCARKKKHS